MACYARLCFSSFTATPGYILRYIAIVVGATAAEGKRKSKHKDWIKIGSAYGSDIWKQINYLTFQH